MLLRADLPKLLQADAVNLRVRAIAQPEFRFELFAEMAAAAFRENVYLA